MITRLALALALGLYIGVFLLGAILGDWGLTRTKDQAEVIVCFSYAVPYMLIGAFGSLWSAYHLFARHRPHYLLYGGL